MNKVSKKYLSWRNEESFQNPKYKSCTLTFKNIDKASDKYDIGFLIAPSEFRVMKSKLNSEIQTNCGYIVQEFGTAPEEISISGRLVDSKNVQESLNFINTFKRLMIVSPNNKNEYTYIYSQQLLIEGVRYDVKITNISYQKTAETPFLYTVNMSLVALSSTVVGNLGFSNNVSRSIILNGTDRTTPAAGTDIDMTRKTLTKRYVF